MDTSNSLGAWLKERRRALDLTQEELALRIGCSVETIQKIESGKRRPSKQMSELLAECLGLPKDERDAFMKLARTERGSEKATPGGGSRALSELSKPPSNLPSFLTRFVGREEQVTTICNYLLHDEARLLTLTGSPGIGKTRLGIEVASLLRGHFRHGVYLVELAPVMHSDLVIPAIANTIGLKESEGHTLLDGLSRYLYDRDILLVLDNFEHVLEAGVVITELLTQCTSVKVLVTSREALNVHGEQQVPVPPLDIPNLVHLPSLEDLRCFPAIDLFVRSAQAVRPDFRLTEGNAGAVTAICARVDGLPLAIELVAARVKLLTPQALLERLSNQLALPASGARSLPIRHQTLLNAISWSYDLLDDVEQALFRRLGVFVGTFTLTSVEAICNARGDLQTDVLDGLASLVNKSLLSVDHQETTEQTFSMLETIRAYSRERLDESGEGETVRYLHAEYYVALAETTRPQLAGNEQKQRADVLEREHDNLRAALQWSLESPQGADLGLRMLSSLVLFWEMRSYLTEGRQWIARILARPEAALPTQDRAWALLGAGRLAISQGDHQAARSDFEESLGISKQIGDRRILAYSLAYVGWAMMLQGEHVVARMHITEGLSLIDQTDDDWGRREIRNLLGFWTAIQNDYPAAREILEGTLASSREAGDRWHSLVPLFLLGQILIAMGDYQAAQAISQEALELAQELGDKAVARVALAGLGKLALNRGEIDQATALFQVGLGLVRELDDNREVAAHLAYLGQVAIAQGDVTRARNLLSESTTIAREHGGRPILVTALNGLGQVALLEDRVKEAEELFKESLRLANRTSNRRSMAAQIAGLAAVAVAAGQLERAARLSGACDAICAAISTRVEPKDRALYDRFLTDARRRVGEAAWTAIYDEGCAMTLDQSVTYALEGVE